MNEQEIDALEGYQLDLAVEKYIFGCEKPTDNIDLADDGYIWEQLENGSWRSEKQKYENGEWRREWFITIWPDEYHDSDFLAFMVVDKILEMHRTVMSLNMFFRGGIWWHCKFITDPISHGCDQSRPTAICRAALKVVIEGIDDV